MWNLECNSSNTDLGSALSGDPVAQSSGQLSLALHLIPHATTVGWLSVSL